MRYRFATETERENEVHALAIVAAVVSTVSTLHDAGITEYAVHALHIVRNRRQSESVR
jgi:hypothetical protein